MKVPLSAELWKRDISDALAFHTPLLQALPDACLMRISDSIGKPWKHPFELERSDEEDDINRCIDVWVKGSGIGISLRRRYKLQYEESQFLNYATEVSVTAKVEDLHGGDHTPEIDKLTRPGFADLYMYAWNMGEGNLHHFVILDWKKATPAILKEAPNKKPMPNHTGMGQDRCWAKYFPLSLFANAGALLVITEGHPGWNIHAGPPF